MVASINHVKACLSFHYLFNLSHNIWYPTHLTRSLITRVSWHGTKRPSRIARSLCNLGFKRLPSSYSILARLCVNGSINGLTGAFSVLIITLYLNNICCDTLLPPSPFGGSLLNLLGTYRENKILVAIVFLKYLILLSLLCIRNKWEHLFVLKYKKHMTTFKCINC